MKRIIGLTIFMGVSSLFGQQPAGPDPMSLEQAREAKAAAAEAKHTVTKVITLKYSNNVGNSGILLLDAIGGLTVKRSNEIVVVTGPPDRVETAEAILKQLDVPPIPPVQRPVVPRKSVQLTAYLIVASRNEIQGAAVPKDLESAVNEVASVFPYKAFNLLDAIDVRLTNGSGGELSGLVPALGTPGQQIVPGGSSYNLDVKTIYLMGDAADLIRIDKFNLTLHMRTPINPSVTLETDIDMKPGQKIVVGKANIDGGADALIVILTGKVVD